MKKLIFRDGSCMFVYDEQIPAIEKGMKNPIGFWCKPATSKDEEWIGQKRITHIKSAGNEAPDVGDKSKRLKAPEREAVDKNAPGYKKFLKAKEELAKKLGTK